MGMAITPVQNSTFRQEPFSGFVAAGVAISAFALLAVRLPSVQFGKLGSALWQARKKALPPQTLEGAAKALGLEWRDLSAAESGWLLLEHRFIVAAETLYGVAEGTLSRLWYRYRIGGRMPVNPDLEVLRRIVLPKGEPPRLSLVPLGRRNVNLFQRRSPATPATRTVWKPRPLKALTRTPLSDERLVGLLERGQRKGRIALAHGVDPAVVSHRIRRAVEQNDIAPTDLTRRLARFSKPRHGWPKP